MKRILCAFLAVLLTIGLLPMIVLAAGYVEAVPPSYIYEYVYPFHDGMARTRTNQDYGYGFIDKTGNEIVPPKYYEAMDFAGGLAWVSRDGITWGLIDKTGKEIVPPKYDKVYLFSEGLAAVGLAGKFGFIDKSGREIVPLKYDDTWHVNNTGGWFFTEGLTEVRLNGK